MKVAIYGRSFHDKYTPFIQHFFDKVKTAEAVYLYDDFASYIRGKIELDITPTLFRNHQDLVNQVDFLFSIGGDGTLLNATRFVRSSGIPIIGVNTGRLGFLSSITLDEIDKALEAIQTNKFKLDERTLLKVETTGNHFADENFGLNELTVHKLDTSSMINVHAYVDDKFLNTYWADGLIIATPTGSTAYSLSCGGPIILPGSGDFVITPVAPHNLNVRPIIVPDSSSITLKMEGRNKQFLVSLDSRSETVDGTIELTITKNNFHINMLRLEGFDYSSTIRTKLNWGLDQRN